MAMAHLQIDEIAARSVLVSQKQRGGPGTDYTLNPYVGCGMGCAYCYVMKFPFAAQNPLPWGAWVQPKMNAPFLLNKARATIWGRRIFLGSATDPYQYIERHYRLTRQCLEILVECNLARLIVHTRSHLILDDLDLLRQFGARLRVGFSVPTDDDRVRKRLEPKAPTIAVRLKTMQHLRAAGIRVHAAVAPVLYCHPRRFATLLREAADGVYCDTMAYTDKTALQALPRAQAYFRSQAYQELVTELQACLQEVGLLAGG
jgi:DNA repair photolyase